MFNLNLAAKYSLAFLWIFTGLTSLFFSPEVGFKILANADITNEIAELAVYAGGLFDIVLGLWIISVKWLRLCCLVQIITIIIYTVLLSIIDISFWLHPFGPVTKNLPILVLILIVFEQEKNA